MAASGRILSQDTITQKSPTKVLCKWRASRGISSTSISTTSESDSSDMNHLIGKWRKNVDIQKKKDILQGNRIRAGCRTKLNVSSESISTKEQRAKAWLDSLAKTFRPVKVKGNATASDIQLKECRKEVDVKTSITKKALNKGPSNVNPTLGDKGRTKKDARNQCLLEETRRLKESFIKPLLNEKTSKSSRIEEPKDFISSGGLSCEKITESKTPLAKKIPPAKPFFPIRSDQKKFSSKLFLGYLTLPGDEELANLRKWKSKQSKKKFMK